MLIEFQVYISIFGCEVFQKAFSFFSVKDMKNSHL